MRPLIIFLFCCALNTVYAADAIKIPPYNKDVTKQCSCNCQNRIAFQHLPVNDKNVLIWAKEAASSVYSYGFGNYYSGLQHASYYFTPEGWKFYTEALLQSGNLNAIVENKMIQSVKVTGKGTLLLKNRNQWKVQIPMQITYANENFTEHQNLLVALTIVKAEDIAGIRGLGIQQLVAKPIASTEN